MSESDPIQISELLLELQSVDDGIDGEEFTGSTARDVLSNVGVDVGEIDAPYLEQLELKKVTIDGHLAWCICIPGIGYLWWSLAAFDPPAN